MYLFSTTFKTSHSTQSAYRATKLTTQLAVRMHSWPKNTITTAMLDGTLPCGSQRQ